MLTLSTIAQMLITSQMATRNQMPMIVQMSTISQVRLIHQIHTITQISIIAQVDIRALYGHLAVTTLWLHFASALGANLIIGEVQVEQATYRDPGRVLIVVQWMLHFMG